LEHPKEGIRRAALAALGGLGDTRSLAALRTFAEAGDPDRPEAKAATEAIKKLSGEKPQVAEVGDLRREVLELQGELKSLRDSFETLKKQGEATTKAKGELSGRENFFTRPQILVMVATSPHPSSPR
jgi:hypothetical protein